MTIGKLVQKDKKDSDRKSVAERERARQNAPNPMLIFRIVTAGIEIYVMFFSVHFS